MLFLKECKKIICSVTFLLYAVAVLAMYMTQFGTDTAEPVTAPVEGSKDYGMVAREVPEIMMPAAIEGLQAEFASGSFVAYPFGLYKEVKLNEKKTTEMEVILQKLSGEVSYEEFRELMREADRLIGGGSKYADEYIVNNFSLVPKTYEDALADYEGLLHEDRVTGAYARLFCDYLGIVVAVLPVFVSASMLHMDRKANMEQIIYARKVSSAKLLITRYLALCSTMLLPIVVTAIMAQINISGIYTGYELDMLAFGKMVGLWLLPNVMAATAVGMLFTICFSPLIAVFVQGGWWFYSLFAGTGGLTGQIDKWVLVARHNSLYARAEFLADYSDFLFNRAFYAGLSLVLVGLSILIYEGKRRGIGSGFGSISKHSGC